MNPDQNSQIFANYKASNPTPVSTTPSSNDWYSGISSGAYRPAGVNPPTQDNQPNQPTNPMVLTSLSRPAQAIGTIVGKGLIGGTEQHIQQNMDVQGKIVQQFIQKAHAETDPTKKQHLLDLAQETTNDMQKSGQNVADLEKQIQDALNIKTPFGTVGALNVDNPDKVKLTENIAGTALKTVSPGISSFAGFGAVHGAGQAMEEGQGIGGVALKSAEEAILSKLFGFGLDKIGGPLANYALSKVPAGAKDLVMGAGKKLLDTLDSGPSVDIGASAMKKLADKVANGADFALSPTKITKSILDKTGLGEAITNKATDMAVKGEIKDWSTPANTNKPGYSKASDVYANAKNNGHDIAETLVNNKIKLSDNVEGGNYNTADTADKLRSDAGKLSSDLLRPSLEAADASTPKTPVSDIVDSTIKDIKSSRSVTAGDTEARIAKARAEGEALARKYPDGMTLSQMHDENINYAKNGKYSPIGDTNVNNTAATNRSLGRTLGSAVKKNAPPDLPIDAFQKELQKQYQAADYLETLHGKKVPKGILSRIAKTSAKVAGAAVGHGLGGGLLGSVGGYHIGGMVEGAIENMPNPIRSIGLANLKVSNPEIYNKVIEYLGGKEAERIGQLALPEPNYIPGKEYKGGESKLYTQEQIKMMGQSPKSLDQSGSVAQPISSANKSSNISPNATTENPESQVKHKTESKDILKSLIDERLDNE